MVVIALVECWVEIPNKIRLAAKWVPATRLIDWRHLESKGRMGQLNDGEDVVD